MKHLLVVAEDRALTRFVAESFLGRSLSELESEPHEEWEISRAHSALEAYTLLTQGHRLFELVLIDQTLPNQDCLNLLARFRDTAEGQDVPIIVMVERGRDHHFRRNASEKFRVAGFIEKPVTEASLRESLAHIDRKRRVLAVESKPEAQKRYVGILTEAGYQVEAASQGREAITLARRFSPDIVVAALSLKDMTGVDVCVELKKMGGQPFPIILYGQAASLPQEHASDNALRADDFVQAPFDDAILLDRIAALIGRGVTPSEPPKSPNIHESTSRIPAAATQPFRPLSRTEIASKATLEYIPRREGAKKVAPPRSASPAAIGPTLRSTRRIPCEISMSIRNEGKVYKSKTLDISHGGIFLSTDKVMAIGTVIDLTFQLPDSDHTINAVGKVVWRQEATTEEGSAGVGVKFSRIATEDLQKIVDYVNRVSRVLYSPPT